MSTNGPRTMIRAMFPFTEEEGGQGERPRLGHEEASPTVRGRGAHLQDRGRRRDRAVVPRHRAPGLGLLQSVGLTLEVAIGTGLNLPHYPPGSRLVGLDLTPEMMSFARRRSSELGLVVPLTLGDAQQLPFADETFDSVVCTYVSLGPGRARDGAGDAPRAQAGGTARARRPHPGNVPPLFWLQRLLELMRRRDRDELTRRPREHVEAVGFTIEDSDRLRAGVVERLVARRP